MEISEFLEEVDRLARQQAALEGRRPEPDHLLPGEDLSSQGDAAHWSQVYGELVRSKENLLAAIRCGAEAAEPESEIELHRGRLALELELTRLRLHERYWTERCTHL